MLQTYLNNYLSANAYAMRTLLINKQLKMKLNNQIDYLQYEIEELKNQLINAENDFENISKYQTININIPFELEQLRVNNKLLKQELENVLNKKLSLGNGYKKTT
jgi:DNA-binding protein YbaB